MCHAHWRACPTLLPSLSPTPPNPNDPLPLPFPAVLAIVFFILLVYLGIIVWRRFVKYMQAKISHVRARVNRQLEGLRKRSAVLAAVLPHAVFFAAGAALLWFPTTREAMDSDVAFFTVAVIVPWVLTMSAVLAEDEGSQAAAEPPRLQPQAGAGAPATPAARQTRGWGPFRWSSSSSAAAPRTPAAASVAAMAPVADDDALLASQRMWLRHWVVGAVFYALHEIPLLGRLFVMVPLAPQIRLLLALWAVMPLVDGAHVLQSCALRFLGRYIGELRATSEKKAEQLGVMQRMASAAAATVLPPRTMQLITNLLDGGYVLAVSVPFFFAPRFMTHFGCTIAGCLLPAFLSSRALLMRPEHGAAARRECRRWLIYWAVYLPLLVAHEAAETIFAGLPFWYDAELVVVVLLQLPFTNYAEKMFRLFFCGEHVRNALAVLTPSRADSIRRRPGANGRQPAAAAPDAAATPLQPRPRPGRPHPLRARLDAATEGAAAAEEKKAEAEPPTQDAAPTEGDGGVNAARPEGEGAAADADAGPGAPGEGGDGLRRRRGGGGDGQGAARDAAAGDE